MSRVGKQQLEIPANTTVEYTGGVFTVKGPLGTLSKNFTDTIAITIENNVISFAPRKDDPFSQHFGEHMLHM